MSPQSHSSSAPPQDPEGFIHSGGWSFLDTSQTDSEEEAEEESEFSPT